MVCLGLHQGGGGGGGLPLISPYDYLLNMAARHIGGDGLYFPIIASKLGPTLYPKVFPVIDICPVHHEISSNQENYGKLSSAGLLRAVAIY